MRILVTGGLGYVGSVVARRLIDLGHEILIVDHAQDSVAERAFPEEILLRQSIESADQSRLVRFSPEVCLHFAACTSVGAGERLIDKYLDNNVVQFRAFMWKLLETGCRRIVMSGTAEVYGSSERPVSETAPLRPESWYAWTKAIADEYLQRLASQEGLDWIIFRYFNVAGTGYGIREFQKNEEHVIPLAIQAAKLGTEFVVNGIDYPTPDGSCVRDYVHVMDIAEAHARAAAALSGGTMKTVINLGSGRGYTILEVLRTIERVTGRRVQWRAGPRKRGDCAIQVAQCDRAKALLSWRPVRGLNVMIQDAWEVQ